MINESMYALGTKPSCIRELFEYGLKQAAIVGKENVFDYSLGNPSVPSPRLSSTLSARWLRTPTRFLCTATPPPVVRVMPVPPLPPI